LRFSLPSVHQGGPQHGTEYGSGEDLQGGSKVNSLTLTRVATCCSAPAVEVYVLAEMINSLCETVGSRAANGATC
jgi:hypothetical protein